MTDYQRKRTMNAWTLQNLLFSTSRFSRYRYFEFTPQPFANCNTVGHPIKIHINAQDVYALPSKSYIKIEGKLRRNDNNNAYEQLMELLYLTTL